MKAIQTKVINLSLILTLLAVTLFSFFTPQTVNANAHLIFVPCVDSEHYGSGRFRDRVCSAPECSFQDYQQSTKTGLCLIVINNGEPQN